MSRVFCRWSYHYIWCCLSRLVKVQSCNHENNLIFLPRPHHRICILYVLSELYRQRIHTHFIKCQDFGDDIDALVRQQWYKNFDRNCCISNLCHWLTMLGCNWRKWLVSWNIALKEQSTNFVQPSFSPLFSCFDLWFTPNYSMLIILLVDFGFYEFLL